MGTFVTNDGVAKIIDLIDNSVVSTSWYGAWGTGTTAAAKTDSAIETEPADEARSAAITPTQPQADTLQWVWTQTCATNPKAIANAGVLDSQTRNAGTLFIHGSFTAISLAVGEQIEFTATMQGTN